MDTNQAICPDTKDYCNIPSEVCFFVTRSKIPVRQCHEVVPASQGQTAETKSLHLFL